MKHNWNFSVTKNHHQSSTHHHHVLLPGLGGVLGGGHRVPLQGDDGLAVAPVRCILLKLLANSEASDFHPDLHRFYPFADLNFSSMLLTVVLVTIVQLPPSSEMVITGVDARAAFLRMKPTPRAFRNSSYFSEETCVYVPVMGAMAIGAALLVSGCAVRWYGCSQPEGWHWRVYTWGWDKQRWSTYNNPRARSLPGSASTDGAHSLGEDSPDSVHTPTCPAGMPMSNMNTKLCTFYHHVNNCQCPLHADL